MAAGQYPGPDHLSTILANAATPASQAQFGAAQAAAGHMEEEEDLTQPPPS